MMQYIEYTAGVVAVYVRTPLMYGSYVKKPIPTYDLFSIEVSYWGE